MKTHISVQERLKDLRVERGLKLEELAEQVGLSKSALGSYENDEDKEINHGSLLKLADFYQVTVDYLLGLSDNRAHENTPLAELHLTDEAVALLKSGQFVNRFLLAHPDRLKACSIGAPGRPTFLNPDEDYFWGIRDFKDYFGYDVDLEAVKKVPVLISVGELDNKFIGDSPYGDNRVARMKSLQKNFQEHGVHTELTILPGFAHEAGEKERVQAAQKFFIQYL